ncbi:hypothetical protein [Bacillus sp. 1P06AnD]|uniref:hypothetical protein n=1 Tax=Bacillus sp. 1P06AnD TaxID=3132208 RepID=UPI0039A3C2AA
MFFEELFRQEHYKKGNRSAMDIQEIIEELIHNQIIQSEQQHSLRPGQGTTNG